MGPDAATSTVSRARTDRATVFGPYPEFGIEIGTKGISHADLYVWAASIPLAVLGLPQDEVRGEPCADAY